MDPEPHPQFPRTERKTKQLTDWFPRPLIASAIALLASAVLLGLFLRDARVAPLYDFEAYYSAAVQIRDGGRLYERALASRDAGFAVGLQGKSVPTQYVYPPIVAITLLPLTVVGLKLAGFFWLTLLFACVIATAGVLTKLLSPSPPRYRPVIVLAVSAVFALFEPLRVDIFQGQIDCLLLLLLALSLAALSQGQRGLPGLWLGLAVAIKPFLGFLIIYLLLTRAYRATALAITVSAALVLLPFVALGRSALSDFIAAERYQSTASFAVSPINQSVHGLLLRLFTANAFTIPIAQAPPLLLNIAGGLVASLAVVLLAFSARQSMRRSNLEWAIGYGQAIVAMLIALPVTESLHYVYLIVPISAMVALGLPVKALGRWRIVASVASIAIYCYFSLPGLDKLVFGLSRPGVLVTMPRLLLTGAYLYGLLALAVLMLPAKVIARTNLHSVAPKY